MVICFKRFFGKINLSNVILLDVVLMLLSSMVLTLWYIEFLFPTWVPLKLEKSFFAGRFEQMIVLLVVFYETLSLFQVKQNISWSLSVSLRPKLKKSPPGLFFLHTIGPSIRGAWSTWAISSYLLYLLRGKKLETFIYFTFLLSNVILEA